jgi:hypothetical protein
MKEVWRAKYGGKGRSRWIDEVVKEYLTNENYFYQQSNFLDLSDIYAYQFILELKDEGSLTKHDENIEIKVGEKVRSKSTIDDPIANEKFSFTPEAIKLLKNSERDIALMKSRIKIHDPRGCIIRTAIEYGLVHDQKSIQHTIDI